MYRFSFIGFLEKYIYNFFEDTKFRYTYKLVVPFSLLILGNKGETIQGKKVLFKEGYYLWKFGSQLAILCIDDVLIRNV